MGGYTCEQINTSDLRIGDIAITNSPLNLVIDDYGTARSLSSSTGHAFIVEEIFFTNGRNCYKDSSPYCAFDKAVIESLQTNEYDYKISWKTCRSRIDDFWSIVNSSNSSSSRL